eukprot:361419-Chlamydomonas_euryale.AAC.1
MHKEARVEPDGAPADRPGSARKRQPSRPRADASARLRFLRKADSVPLPEDLEAAVHERTSAPYAAWRGPDPRSPPNSGVMSAVMAQLTRGMDNVADAVMGAASAVPAGLSRGATFARQQLQQQQQYQQYEQQYQQYEQQYQQYEHQQSEPGTGGGRRAAAMRAPQRAHAARGSAPGVASVFATAPAQMRVLAADLRQDLKGSQDAGALHGAAHRPGEAPHRAALSGSGPVAPAAQLSAEAAAAALLEPSASGPAALAQQRRHTASSIGLRSARCEGPTSCSSVRLSPAAGEGSQSLPPALPSSTPSGTMSGLAASANGASVSPDSGLHLPRPVSEGVWGQRRLS